MSLTFLVAEDDPSIRKILRRIVEGLGHRMIEAADGQEAIGIIKDPAISFEVLLTDGDMPAANGLEVLRAANVARPGLATALMTGRVAVYREAAENVGARVYEKPFSNVFQVIKELTVRYRELQTGPAPTT